MNVEYEPSLGRNARHGAMAQLSLGSFDQAARACHEQRWSDAADLIEVTVLEAEELHDVYDRWPASIRTWLIERGIQPADLEAAQQRLTSLLGHPLEKGIARRWPEFVQAVEEAATACRCESSDAEPLVRVAHDVWQEIHDQAVDLVSGMIDAAVRLAGEDHLGALWDHLMADWYDLHEHRYALGNQSWQESSRQLAIAIFDGFHAHLNGVDRSGQIEVIEEPDRIGFRFAPCGSGGRSTSAAITGGVPRAGAPFNFAVTTTPHDWAWNTVGICSYCVHCCQLNEIMPIDRLGYPTRVVDAPTWPNQDGAPHCTWWIYRHPSLVPDEVYHRVGRSPDRRPAPDEGAS